MSCTRSRPRLPGRGQPASLSAKVTSLVRCLPWHTDSEASAWTNVPVRVLRHDGIDHGLGNLQILMRLDARHTHGAHHLAVDHDGQAAFERALEHVDAQERPYGHR